MDATTLKEVARYLPTSTLKSLKEVDKSMQHLTQTLEEDWFFWKSKLEEEHNAKVEWIDVNWKYVYSLFEGTDPKIVALNYSFDARIIKTAYEL